MKWFDRKEIKDESGLTSEQIAYLRKPSVTFLGPFNILVRQHWDLIITGLVSSMVLSIASTFLLANLISESEFITLQAGQVAPHAWLIVLMTKVPGYIVDVFILYFGIKHGRRLSWNRNHWNSFDDFKKSEDKWTPWGWLVAILIGVDVIYTIYSAILIQLYPGIVSALGK